MKFVKIKIMSSKVTFFSDRWNINAPVRQKALVGETIEVTERCYDALIRLGNKIILVDEGSEKQLELKVEEQKVEEPKAEIKKKRRKKKKASQEAETSEEN